MMDMQTTAAPKLNDLEWQAVSVALSDATTCGCGDVVEPKAITRILRSIFGIKPAQPLADPKLEAVRRFVCMAKLHGVVDAQRAILSKYGYNGRQIAAMVLLSR